MSELDSEQTKIEVRCSTDGEKLRQGDTDAWKETVVPFLCTIPSVVVEQILQECLPIYQALGIACIVGGLVVFRFRAQRYRRYGFGKWMACWLLISAGVSMLSLGLSALWPTIFKR